MVRNGLRFDGWLRDVMVSTQGYERTRESGETLKEVWGRAKVN